MSSNDDRSVKAREIIGSQVITGDHNQARMQGVAVTLPPAESVDVAAELAALRELLVGLDTPDAGKLERALQDAEEEAAKPAPDRDEIGGAIERAVKYAKGASDFSAHVAKLAPRLAALAAWLGAGWDKILG